MPGIEVREEAPGDEDAARAVHLAAFESPFEAAIVDALRGTGDWLPDLSLVAVDGSTGEIVGHVLAVHATLEREDAPPGRVLVLGPIGVLPVRQGEGIGGRLMRRAIGAAVRRAEPAIALLGHPTWYPRFGFEPARRVGLEPPAAWPDDAWMALLLPAWTPDLRGTVRYPAPYRAGVG